MHMKIDQAGEHQSIFARNDLSGIHCGQVIADIRNPAVRECNIFYGMDSPGGIDEGSAF
jgi:hypothetical protein